MLICWPVNILVFCLNHGMKGILFYKFYNFFTFTTTSSQVIWGSLLLTEHFSGLENFTFPCANGVNWRNYNTLVCKSKLLPFSNHEVKGLKNEGLKKLKKVQLCKSTVCFMKQGVLWGNPQVLYWSQLSLRLYCSYKIM